MVSKKGQSMSINVVIVAALALIVLVVLAAIFIGRTAQTEKGISKESNTELVKYKSLYYGDCHPADSMEQSFLTKYSQADSDVSKEQAQTEYESEISRCKGAASKDDCASQSCKWK